MGAAFQVVGVVGNVPIGPLPEKMGASYNGYEAQKTAVHEKEALCRGGKGPLE